MADLKLAALDADDLAVVAAHVQDAVAKVGDIEWRPREKRLLVQVNRFVWEAAGNRSKTFERRRAVLHFARVEAVQATKIRRGAPDAVLNLLTLRFEATDEPAGYVYLDFSGGGSLRLKVECIEASLADLGAAWATENLPVHEA